MPAKFKMRVFEIGNSLKITIPKPLANGLRINKGDCLVIESTNDKIIMKKE